MLAGLSGAPACCVAVEWLVRRQSVRLETRRRQRLSGNRERTDYMRGVRRRCPRREA